jgi:Alginate lyase
VAEEPAAPVAESPAPSGETPATSEEPPIVSADAPATPPAEEPVPQEAATDPDDAGDAPSNAEPPAPRAYIWLSPSEIRALPITGDPNCNARCRGAWRLLNRASSEIPVPPNLADINDDAGTLALAKALVAVRLGDSPMATALRDEVVSLLGLVIGTEAGASALAIGRGTVSYVIAADIIDLPAARPQFDQILFRPWLRSLLEREFEGRTLRSCQEDRPNNWGTHCGASRTAIAAYLDDRAEMAGAATVFQGWLGDRQIYSGFRFDVDAFGWMSDVCLATSPDCQPLPVNPPGATVAGHNVDGVIVDDQRRAGAFTWPPTYTVYYYGALGGAAVQAGILQRFGFDAWQWGNQALRRAVEWMFYDGDGKTRWDTCGDSNKRYVLDLVDHAYGSGYIGRMSCAPDASREGRNIAWTSWTHQR